MTFAFVACAISMAFVATVFATSPLLARKADSERGNIQLPLLIAIVLLLGSILVYAAISSPDYAPTETGYATDQLWKSPAVEHDAGKAASSVSSLLAGLEQRLERQPNDGKGWLLLAKSYDHLGRSDDAKVAYEKAAALGITDTEFAESVQSPAHRSSSAPGIHGQVSVSPDVAADVLPGDVVFVIASLSDGNPMPVAVVRRPAADLPFEFVLDDSTSMVKQSGMPNDGNLDIKVKISRTGDALSSIEGIGATATNVSVSSDAAVELLISRTE